MFGLFKKKVEELIVEKRVFSITGEDNIRIRELFDTVEDKKTKVDYTRLWEAVANLHPEVTEPNTKWKLDFACAFNIKVKEY